MKFIERIEVATFPLQDALGLIDARAICMNLPFADFKRISPTLIAMERIVDGVFGFDADYLVDMSDIRRQIFTS